MLMSNLKGPKFSLVRQKSLSGEVFQKTEFPCNMSPGCSVTFPHPGSQLLVPQSSKYFSLVD